TERGLQYVKSEAFMHEIGFYAQMNKSEVGQGLSSPEESVEVMVQIVAARLCELPDDENAMMSPEFDEYLIENVERIGQITTEVIRVAGEYWIKRGLESLEAGQIQSEHGPN